MRVSARGEHSPPWFIPPALCAAHGSGVLGHILPVDASNDLPGSDFPLKALANHPDPSLAELP